MSDSPLILLAAGGTGGHVFPAEAVARALLDRGYRLALVTDRRGTAYGGALGQIPAYRLRAASPSGGTLARVRGAIALSLGIARAIWLLWRLRPAAVLGFGGYASVPAMLAATWLGLPTAIHEQNAILGRANRLLAGSVKRIALSHAEVGNLRAALKARTVLTGNPVRPAIAALANTAYARPALGEPLRLLVIGGSQGANVFARVVPAAVAALPHEARRRLAIVQQCRPEDLENVRAQYREARVEAELAPFFADMPERLAGAHLVIARAGASTVAEIALAGRPAVLVPYPYATDDHQRANAASLADAGGAWLVPEPEFTPEKLLTLLASFLADATPLAGAATAVRAQARPNAAEALADLVESLIQRHEAQAPIGPRETLA